MITTSLEDAMMTFSVVIPAKNEEVNISRCLESIWKVEWDSRDFEVIVVDNGSTDRTVTIAKEMGARVFEKPEATISGLRNYGVSVANGSVIAFLDADCTVTPGWFQAASRYLQDDDVVAFGSPVAVPEGGTWVQTAWFNVRGKPSQVEDVEWLESANLLVKRDAFLCVGGFEKSLVTCEDYDLTQRLKPYGRIISDWRVAAIHYREPSTICEFVKKEMWRSKSNYVGLFSRKINIKELPSLVFPLLYIIFCLTLCVSLGAYFSRLDLISGLFIALLLAVWQFPFCLYAFRKNRSGNITIVLQLFVLLNLYFFARGLAVFKRG